VTNEPVTSTVLEEARWFGPAEGRLFGWLMRPDVDAARGGVVLAQPVGREARAARRAMRSLGIELAKRGFVVVRLDYPGTGDSSGSLQEIDVQRAWVDAIGDAAAFLQSLGVNDVSAVGMRLGAVVVGLANAKGLALSSLVLWDPCESGRQFLREVGALESLRRADFEAPIDGSCITSEWVFRPTTVEQIRGMDLLSAASDIRADRLLIITRDDRAFSEKLRSRLESRSAEWEVTSEQRAMLDVEPLDAVLATNAIRRIATWLDESDAQCKPLVAGDTDPCTTVSGRRDDPRIQETFVRLGRRRLFGIVSAPLGQSCGPLVVLLNVANEEHIGPSRLWVELSRGWSGEGLRCVRFDLSGIGDSPSLPMDPTSPWYEPEWLDDVEDVARQMQPEDPTNVVFVGLCSGAYLALEGAFAVGATGACVINPPVGIDLLHASTILRKLRVKWLKFIAKQTRVLQWNRWVAAGSWQILRVFLPRRLSQDLMATVVEGGTTLFVLASIDDISPYPNIPVLRSIDRRRVVAPRNYKAEIIPGLDHSMHAAKGRDLAMASLDRFVRDRFVVVTPESASGA